jgi:hypothetical protein
MRIAKFAVDRRPRSALVAAIALFICEWIGGCRRPPAAGEIAGTWESRDKSHTFVFRSDGTYSLSGTTPKPASIEEMLANVMFDVLAPSGQWRLDEWELHVTSDPSSKSGAIPASLKVVSCDDSTLVLRFGDAEPVPFLRKP